MKIAVDAMGGDNAPKEIIKGGIDAARLLQKGVEIVFIGPKEKIQREIEKNNGYNLPISTVNAEEVIDNNESPVKAIKTKKNSSMVIGLNLLKNKEVDAFISAGSTGAFMAGALLITGRIKGIDRPALASVIPTIKGGILLLDMGANTDVKPKNLLQFAVMGSIYSNKVLGIKNPKIALLNVGKEQEKGNLVTKEAYKLLCNEPSINFIGNMEAREILQGNADVLVCDGFSGNILLKAIEGVATTFFSVLKEEIKTSYISQLGGLLIKSHLKKFKKKFDYSEHGGAPFLGIKGVCIKCHGSSDASAIKNAILKGETYVEKNIIESFIKEFSDEGAI